MADLVPLLGELVQTAYLTILILVVAFRVSNRIAVMEFQVQKLWSIMEAELVERRHGAPHPPDHG